MEYMGFTLDPFQEQAIKAIDKNKSVIVSAPTGSGKTLVADYLIDKYLKKGVRIIYTAPIKALSNQKYKEFSALYGAKNIGLVTGDIVENPEAPVVIMTTEIYRNMTITNDPKVKDVKYVIFDEIHYLNDPERGHVWEESIIFSPSKIRMLCLSATIPNAQELADWISAIKEHDVAVITSGYRHVPLHINFFDTELGVTSLQNLKDIVDIPDYKYIKGRRKRRRPKVDPPSHVDLIKDIKRKVPCFYFTFSRSRCQHNAMELSNKNMFPINPKITKIVINKLKGAPTDINKLESVKTLRTVLPQGIAFHHAGLLPIMKELVEELFAEGLINVLYTTETFAVGINMPAKTTCFESLRKFDGVNFRFLTSKEYFQIAGRAGRRGIDTEGFVFIMIDRRDFDYKKIKSITDRDIEPIQSQYRLSVNTVINLILLHTKEEIDEILCKSLYSYQKYGEEYGHNILPRSHNAFNNIVRKLEKMNYLDKGEVTDKGKFAAKIYSDEIITSEIFATTFYTQLNEYQMVLLIACICYEPRERTEFEESYPSKDLAKLKRYTKKEPFLRSWQGFYYLDDITAFVYPIYNEATIFDVMDNTNLLEGDVIRFFKQIIDRLRQVQAATKDRALHDKLGNCIHTVKVALEDVDVV